MSDLNQKISEAFNGTQVLQLLTRANLEEQVEEQIAFYKKLGDPLPCTKAELREFFENYLKSME